MLEGYNNMSLTRRAVAPRYRANSRVSLHKARAVARRPLCSAPTSITLNVETFRIHKKKNTLSS